MTSKLVFLAEDFKEQERCEHGINNFGLHAREIIAKQAQVLFDSWLKEQINIYVSYQGAGIYYASTHNDSYVYVNPTHKAYLVCLEEIVKCKHEKEKVKEEKTFDKYLGYFKCQCGVKVEPTSFREVEK